MIGILPPTMYGDHTYLFLIRLAVTIFTLLSFFLFFIGIGTQTWFVVTNGALSFTLSPVKFCNVNGDCSDIDWSTFPVPPCGISSGTIESRYRTVTGFSVLAGLCTLFIFTLCLLTFCSTRKPKYIEILAAATLASGSFGFIAASLWGYTVENYQYCGVPYCEHMLTRSLASSSCSASLSHSFNSVIVASTFMWVSCLLCLLHIFWAPKLDLEDPDAVVSKMVPEKIMMALDRSQQASPKTTSRALQPYDFENDRINQTRKSSRHNSPNNGRTNNNATNNKKRHHYNTRNDESRMISGAPRNEQSSMRKIQRNDRSYLVDGEELADFSQHQQRSINNNSYNNSSFAAIEDNHNNNTRRNNTTTTTNKKRVAADVWVPPRGSDYQREPQTGLWWSAAKPNEYVDGKTGHILFSEECLWYDPKSEVYYEVEEEED